MLVAIAPTGCGQRAEDDPKQTTDDRNKPDARATGLSETALTEIAGVGRGRFDGRLASLTDKVQPASDDWDTEVLGEVADKRLKEIAAILRQSGIRPGDIKASHVAALASDEFSTASLRPGKLREVFSDKTVIVRRGDTRTDRSYSGADGLATALGELIGPFRGASDIRAKFKLFRVTKHPRAFSTEAYYQASATTDGGAVQQSATWTCRWVIADDDPPRLAAITVRDYEEIAPGANGGIRFEDCTGAVLGRARSFREQLGRGVDYWRGRLEANYGVDPNGNQGIAIGDANGDGLDDIYVCQQGGLPNRLYIQNLDGTLSDVSVTAGVDWMEVSRGALFIDLDNDADQDLVIAQGWHVIVMKNSGKGAFGRVLQRHCDGHVYSIAAADYDNDGDLDLFFCGRNPSREMGQPEGILGTPIPYHDANNGGPNMLWRNDGELRFTNVTKEVGLDANNRRYSYAASWEDYDNDGDQDLYVANDFGRNNLYRSDRGRFTDVAAELGVEDMSAGMSVTWGDYDNDGRMDLYVSNMFSAAGNRIAYQKRFREEVGDSSRAHFQRHARGNSLFHNVADDRLDDVSEAAAVTMGRWAWGAKFVDLNNDGREDLYVANGFITTDDTGDL